MCIFEGDVAGGFLGVTSVHNLQGEASAYGAAVGLVRGPRALRESEVRVSCPDGCASGLLSEAVSAKGPTPVVIRRSKHVRSLGWDVVGGRTQGGCSQGTLKH